MNAEEVERGLASALLFAIGRLRKMCQAFVHPRTRRPEH